MTHPVKIESWCEQLIVDPLSKGPLRREGEYLLSDYGRKYPIIDGIYDLRVSRGNAGSSLSKWREGQKEYEKFAKGQASSDALQDYVQEKEGVAHVYREIPIIGRCIDIGGHQGRLRAFVGEGQEYLSVDPFLDAFQGVELQQNLLNVFPFLLQPVNFVCAYAEHLPIAAQSFDTVHMRSCIDHLFNPELSLLEAYRVLKPDGQIIIGLYVEGGKTAKATASRVIKNGIKRALSLVASRFDEHHMWHPTYGELLGLIESCGFRIEKTIWQEGCNDQVCYIKSVK